MEYHRLFVFTYFTSYYILEDNGLLIIQVYTFFIQINNNEHDGGMLVGNYSGKYDDGVAPYAWNGSSAILEEYLKKRKGVKYGQCWTFAAVTTTGIIS